MPAKRYAKPGGKVQTRIEAGIAEKAGDVEPILMAGGRYADAHRE
jgi:hypothetical protein